MRKKYLNDKWLYLPIFVLLANFIYRLIDQSKLLFYFPIGYNNDISSYMAQLYFLKVCGFLDFCSYWYNGFISFQFTSPGWFFFALPFYYLFGDVKVATYITMVLSFVLAFFVIYIAGKYFKFSRIQRVAFFAFMFMTSLSVGSFIRLGRVHELFSWVWFLLFAFLVLYYKNRNLDSFSLLIIPVFSLTIFSYMSVGVLASVLFLGLFFVKNLREKFLLIIYFLASFLLISFWFIPLATNIFSVSTIPSWTQGEWLWEFSAEQLFTNIAAFLLPLIVFILFYFYWLSNKKSKNELYFFLPVLVLCLLFFLRLIGFIPIFGNIFPDPYLTYFLFFTVFLFFSLDYSVLNKFLFRLLPILLIFLAIASVLISIFYTPKFVVPDDAFRLELEPLLSRFSGSFLLFGDYPTTIYSKAVYSYAPVYYNLSTPLGWYPELTTPEYLDRFYEFDYHKSMNCETFESDLKFFNTTHVIGYTNTCNKFSECEFEFVDKNGNFCLYKV